MTNLENLKAMRSAQVVKILDGLKGEECFDITIIRKAAKFLGISVESNDLFDEIRLYHCMSYSDMDSSLLQALSDCIKELLQLDAGTKLAIK